MAIFLEKNFTHTANGISLIDLWNKGIEGLDPELISHAVQAGIDVDVPVRSIGGKHPLVDLLNHHAGLESNPIIAEDMKMVVHLILNEGPDLSQESNTLGAKVIDEIAVSDYRDTEILADIVIKAIHDKACIGEDLEMNYKAIFANVGLPDNPYSTKRQEYMSRIVGLHEVIAEKLTGPDDLYARDLVDTYPNIAGDWILPFQAPDLADLPCPSKEYVNAVRTMNQQFLSARAADERDNIDEVRASVKKAKQAMKDVICEQKRIRDAYESSPGLA